MFFLDGVWPTPFITDKSLNSCCETTVFVNFADYHLILGLLSVRGTEDKDRCQEVSTINCDTHYVPDGDERVCSSDMKDCPTL